MIYNLHNMTEEFFVTSFGKIGEESLFDGKVLRKVFETENIEIVSYVYKKGAKFPAHSHPEEQVTIVTNGEISFEVDGVEIYLKSGDICYLPPNKAHSARVTMAEEVHTINVFYPRRSVRPAHGT